LRRRDQAVVIDTPHGTELVTTYGTPDERKAMVEWLRSRLSLLERENPLDPVMAPPGWTMIIEGGTAVLTCTDPRSRRIGSLIMWAIVALMGLIWYGASVTSSAGTVVAAALTMLVTFGAAWVTWSRREWRARHGELTAHTRFLLWHRERTFRGARLEVVLSTDSDSDDHYRLNVIDADGRRQIASEMNDHAETLDLARWLAARTGFQLTLPRQLQ
jgi:hypothetical protein